MYGVGEYVEYRGYEYSTLYNQYVDAEGLTYGFTSAQYRGEIDGGRPVMIQIDNHSMFGFGYEYDEIEQMTWVYVHDTWTETDNTLVWGWYYLDTGWDHYGVMPLTIAGGETLCDYCLVDTYGYTWCLNEVQRTSLGIYLRGTCDASGDNKLAEALYRWGNGALDMTAYAGNGIVFTYNARLGTTSQWISSNGGHGTVTVNYCSGSQGDEVQEHAEGLTPNSK
jgi:hypothetical protein